jgi:hypothetical protein
MNMIFLFVAGVLAFTIGLGVSECQNEKRYCGRTATLRPIHKKAAE